MAWHTERVRCPLSASCSWESPRSTGIVISFLVVFRGRDRATASVQVPDACVNLGTRGGRCLALPFALPLWRGLAFTGVGWRRRGWGLRLCRVSGRPCHSVDGRTCSLLGDARLATLDRRRNHGRPESGSDDSADGDGGPSSQNSQRSGQRDAASDPRHLDGRTNADSPPPRPKVTEIGRTQPGHRAICPSLLDCLPPRSCTASIHLLDKHTPPAYVAVQQPLAGTDGAVAAPPAAGRHARRPTPTGAGGDLHLHLHLPTSSTWPRR